MSVKENFYSFSCCANNAFLYRPVFVLFLFAGVLCEPEPVRFVLKAHSPPATAMPVAQIVIQVWSCTFFLGSYFHSISLLTQVARTVTPSLIGEEEDYDWGAFEASVVGTTDATAMTGGPPPPTITAAVTSGEPNEDSYDWDAFESGFGQEGTSPLMASASSSHSFPATTASSPVVVTSRSMPTSADVVASLMTTPPSTLVSSSGSATLSSVPRVGRVREVVSPAAVVTSSTSAAVTSSMSATISSPFPSSPATVVSLPSRSTRPLASLTVPGIPTSVATFSSSLLALETSTYFPSTASSFSPSSSSSSSLDYVADDDTLDPVIDSFQPDSLLVTYDPSDFLPPSSGSVTFHEYHAVLVYVSISASCLLLLIVAVVVVVCGEYGLT